MNGCAPGVLCAIVQRSSRGARHWAQASTGTVGGSCAVLWRGLRVRARPREGTCVRACGRKKKRERENTFDAAFNSCRHIFGHIWNFYFLLFLFFFFRFACFFHRHHKSAEEPPPHLTCFSKSIMQVWRICWGLYVVVIISWVGSLPDPTSCCIIIADRSTGNLLERGNCWTGCRAN